MTRARLTMWLLAKNTSKRFLTTHQQNIFQLEMETNTLIKGMGTVTLPQTNLELHDVLYAKHEKQFDLHPSACKKRI